MCTPEQSHIASGGACDQFSIEWGRCSEPSRIDGLRSSEQFHTVSERPSEQSRTRGWARVSDQSHIEWGRPTERFHIVWGRPSEQSHTKRKCRSEEPRIEGRRPSEQIHIVWGNHEDKSSASESDSLSDQVLSERPRMEQLQSLGIVPDEVTFLSMSSSHSHDQSSYSNSDSSNSGKRKFLSAYGTRNTNEITWSTPKETQVSTAAGSVIRNNCTTAVSWGADKNSEKEASKALDDISPPINVGSMQHFDGNCKPCLLFKSKNGCKRGINCPFCHYEHEKIEKVKKPCKGQRERYRKLVDKLTQDILKDPVAFDADTVLYPPSYEKDETSKGKLILKLKQIQQSVLAARQNVLDNAEHRKSSTFISL